MSGILGVFGADMALHCDARVHALVQNGATVPMPVACLEFDATLMVVPAAGGGGAAGRMSVARDESLFVAADASLYHLDDLPRRIRAQLPPRASAAQIVLAAYRTDGEACTAHLEGDYAFVVWDARHHRMIAARDFSGRRPLHIAERAGTVLVASRLEELGALPSVGATVDDAAVGADAAGLFFALDDDTCMRGVRTLRAGWSATWSDRGLQMRRAWTPEPGDGAALNFEDAAVHLRELLVDAVATRLDPDAPTSVWMSGGRDSTAVFAAGMLGLRSGKRHTQALVPVSRSHPPGDSGREDEAIAAVGARWNVTPRWVDARAVPMLVERRRGCAWRSDPFTQPFENLTRALAHESGVAGTRIALDGFGGDFLFQVSHEYLADLVRTGHLREAAADWHVIDEGREGWKGFVRSGVMPLLPRWVLRAAAVARGGRPLRRAMEREAPPWIDPDFVTRHRLHERVVALGVDAQAGTSTAERETRFMLTHQFFARVNAMMASFAADEGIEIRSPLMDRRVVAFALARPRIERNRAGDRKLLLRAAMRGLLPDDVLAPRRTKTGTLTTYFHHRMHTEGVPRLRAIADASRLAARGIAHAGRLAAAATRYAAAGPGAPEAEALYCTLVAEEWLRAHDQVVTAQAVPARASSAPSRQSPRPGVAAPVPGGQPGSFQEAG